jgi:hypothetical protein
MTFNVPGANAAQRKANFQLVTARVDALWEAWLPNDPTKAGAHAQNATFTAVLTAANLGGGGNPADTRITGGAIANPTGNLSFPMRISTNAAATANYFWDTTPATPGFGATNAEFSNFSTGKVGLGRWTTAVGDTARNNLDMLTVLVHEVGHAVGFSNLFYTDFATFRTTTWNDGAVPATDLRSDIGDRPTHFGPNNGNLMGNAADLPATGGRSFVQSEDARVLSGAFQYGFASQWDGGATGPDTNGNWSEAARWNQTDTVPRGGLYDVVLPGPTAILERTITQNVANNVINKLDIQTGVADSTNTLNVDEELIVLNEARVRNRGRLTGDSALRGRIKTDAGSNVIASGNMTLGDNLRKDAIEFDGNLVVGKHTVTVNDRNAAVFNAVVQIGDPTGVGKVVAAQGVEMGPASTLRLRGKFDRTTPLKHIEGKVDMKTGSKMDLGASPGVGTILGDVAFDYASELEIEILGPGVPGITSDLLQVEGRLNLDASNSNLGATLNLLVDPIYPPIASFDDTFVIVENDGIDQIRGNFYGLPHGSRFVEDNVKFLIDYKFDLESMTSRAGNDIALRVIPEPSSLFLLLPVPFFIVRLSRRGLRG